MSTYSGKKGKNSECLPWVVKSIKMQNVYLEWWKVFYHLLLKIKTFSCWLCYTIFITKVYKYSRQKLVNSRKKVSHRSQVFWKIEYTLKWDTWQLIWCRLRSKLLWIHGLNRPYLIQSEGLKWIHGLNRPYLMQSEGLKESMD